MIKYFFLGSCLLFISPEICGKVLLSLSAQNNNSRTVDIGGIETVSSETSCYCVAYFLCEDGTFVTNDLIDIRPQTSPCENFLDICCERPKPEAEKIIPIPLPKRNGCGRSNPDGVGFRKTENEDGEAQIGEFPWMVAVEKGGEPDGGNRRTDICGGSLIHPEVVMTAAHCVYNAHSNITILAGEWDIQTRNELFPRQNVLVKKVVIHPDFYPDALYNDVALLFLDSAITLADNIDIVCLPRHNFNYLNSRCFVSRWSKNVFGNEGKYEVILKKVELPMVPHKQCENALKQTRLDPYFNLHTSFVCAGGDFDKYPCKGNGGSPLVCSIPGTDNYAQVGIVTPGIGCGEGNTPGVYANVGGFRDWIDEQFLDNGLDTKYYDY